jgi:preprotein translocase subunit SecD
MAQRVWLVAVAALAAACGGGDDAGEERVDTGPDAVTLTYETDPGVTDADVERMTTIIRGRLAELGAGGVTVQADGESLVVEVDDPGSGSADELAAAVGTQAELRFRPVLLTVPLGGAPDVPLEVTPADEDRPEATVVLDEPEQARYQLGPAEATGSIIEDADAQLANSGQWMVDLTLTPEGIVVFNEIAARCSPPSASCPTGQLGIVLDSEVQSAPTIESASFDREDISISGSFTEAEAKDLALVLRYGALPFPVTLVSVSGP